MKKTQEAYKGLLNGQKLYFEFSLAGYQAAIKMSHDTGINMILKYVHVSTNKQLLN